MIQLNYRKDVVMFADIRAQDGGVKPPTVARLQQRDQFLFRRFDKALRQVLAGLGLKTDKNTRSEVLMLALVAKGKSKPLVKVQNAAGYYQQALQVIIGQ